MWVWRSAAVASMLASLSSCAVSAPGRTETAVMSTLKRRITVGGKNARNPFPPTPENINRGRQIFSSYCVACHGLDGQATGVPFATAMSPPIPDLASPAVQAYTDGQLNWIIGHGLSPSGMPAARGILHNEEIWAIVTYLRHLPAKGSLGEPSMYGDSSQGGR